MARTWRRRWGRDTWHFCSNCTEWPSSGCEESKTEPVLGSGQEFCDQCLSKEKKKDCED
jgi:hypothetical protein